MEGREREKGRGMKGQRREEESDLLLVSTLVVEQLLTIVLPRVKDFHNLLTRRPSVSCNNDI